MVIRNKSQLIAKVYSQFEGIDYDETYAPFVGLGAIGIFLVYAVYKNVKVYQMDVKSAFLNGENLDPPHYYYKLEKDVNDLKQTPRAW